MEIEIHRIKSMELEKFADENNFKIVVREI